MLIIAYVFLRFNYNMLLTMQLEYFPLYISKHLVHAEVPIQLQESWLIIAYDECVIHKLFIEELQKLT